MTDAYTDSDARYEKLALEIEAVKQDLDKLAAKLEAVYQTYCELYPDEADTEVYLKYQEQCFTPHVGKKLIHYGIRIKEGLISILMKSKMS